MKFIQRIKALYIYLLTKLSEIYGNIKYNFIVELFKIKIKSFTTKNIRAQ